MATYNSSLLFSLGGMFYKSFATYIYNLEEEEF